MKRLFILLMLSVAFTFGCSEKKAETNEHIHEDGTTHADHEATEPVKQEEFEVKGDSLKTDSVHTHEDGETHAH